MKAVYATLALVFASLSTPSAAAPGPKGGQVVERVVRLTALGSVRATPDAVQIGIAIATEADTAQAALEQNRAAMGKTIAELGKSGVEEADVQGVDLSVHPRYQRAKDGASATINGYRVINSSRVTARNLSKLGEVLDKIVAAGPTQIDRIEFVISDPIKLLDEARKQAMVNARRKAELYAESAGAQIGDVISVDEQRVSRPNRLVRATPKDAPYGDSSFQPSEDDAQVEVSVVWELIDKKQ